MDPGDDTADRPTFPDDPSGQHGPLRAKLETLEALVNAKGSGQDFRQILDALTDDFRHHFEAEERAMERGEYPLLEDHHLGHLRFLGQLETLRREYVSNGSVLSPAVIVQLRSWFEDHVQSADKDTFEFLGLGR